MGYRTIGKQLAFTPPPLSPGVFTFQHNLKIYYNHHFSCIHFLFLPPCLFSFQNSFFSFHIFIPPILIHFHFSLSLMFSNSFFLCLSTSDSHFYSQSPSFIFFLLLPPQYRNKKEEGSFILPSCYSLKKLCLLSSPTAAIPPPFFLYPDIYILQPICEQKCLLDPRTC
ncbi:unnamed protein product [Acanthosepion pharaonis]|uniref:Uncharacterized protein n=1 Tax=Acanthosepion pharaonis TaxID=158019 RepID=A0A812CDD1_ACAPH|nr:unnamed protein product [Sepia pharaonis]